MPTYEPKSKTRYVISQGDVEDWLREQYDVPSFSVPVDLEEFGSPEGTFTTKVDGEISEYRQDDVDEFFGAVEEEKQTDGYYSEPHTRLLTGPLLNKLAADGHIPEGTYNVKLSY